MKNLFEKIIQFFRSIGTDFNPAEFVPENLTEFQLFLGSLIILALITLWCIIDVIGALFSLYIIKYTDIEKKYPKLKIIIRYYSNVNYVYITYQIIFLLLVYFTIIWTGLSLLYKSFSL